jgi:YidC/Oxa1 family membrane protein insertase
MFKSDHSEYRNVILAALLSFLIVIGWQYFFITPRVEKSNQLAKAASLNASAENKLWSNSTGVDIDGHTLSNQTALDGTDSVVAESSEIVAKRITIETSRLGGGINLKGAKVDSLFLKDYTESKEKNSKNVEILSEQGTPHPYYVIQGWTSADSNFRTPGHDTIWEVMPESSDILSPEASVVLKWSGSQGVEFYRTFTVDNNFMIHIQDRVVNKRKKPIKIAPYGIILRQNLEKQRAFFVLHEGAIGMLDERLIELPYKDIREFPFKSKV